MLNGKRVLAWIPARGGSKGIKDKNIRMLCDKPLIAYTIEAALQSMYVDTVMVSTDSERIAKTAETYGAWVPELRPANLASDTSKTIDAVLYSLERLEDRGEHYDVFCLLQPTSPLRTTEDINHALEIYEKYGGGYDIVGVSPVKTSPVLIRMVGEDGRLKKLLEMSSTIRRQDMPSYYEVNGSIYINAVTRICQDTSFNDNAMPYVMEENHSVDIDEWRDLEQAEGLLRKVGRIRGVKNGKVTKPVF